MQPGSFIGLRTTQATTFPAVAFRPIAADCRHIHCTIPLKWLKKKEKKQRKEEKTREEKRREEVK